METPKTNTAAVVSTALSGVDLIRAERERQINGEGWSAEHDDTHTKGELARAAATYALSSAGRCYMATFHWPWKTKNGGGYVVEAGFKPENEVRDLVRAGALIAAEIDRIHRKGSQTTN